MRRYSFIFALLFATIAGAGYWQNAPSLVLNPYLPFEVIPDDIIIDDDDANAETVSGSWARATTLPAQHYADSARYGSSGGTDVWRFTPDIPQDGQYRVYAWWTEKSNRSDQVAHDVTHAGGTTTVEKNQKIDGGQWNELGTYTFDAGTDGYMEVSDRNGIYAIADAVKFEWVGI